MRRGLGFRGRREKSKDAIREEELAAKWRSLSRGFAESFVKDFDPEKTVCLLDHMQGGVVRGLELKEKIIVGPMLILPVRTHFRANQFHENPSKVLVDVEMDERRNPDGALAGAVPAIDCVFDGCFFVKVGIVGTKEDNDMLRESFKEGYIQGRLRPPK